MPKSKNKKMGTSPLMEAWHRLRKNPRAVVSMGFLVLLFLVAIFAEVIFDYNDFVVKQDPVNKLLTPDAQHWFGTDVLGRDIFARIIHGARVAIILGFGSTAITVICAATLGMVAAYYGGIVDSIITRIIDILLTIPMLLLAIAVVAGFGNGMIQLVMALAISAVPIFTRIVRSAALTVVNQEYVEAAKALGASDARIMLKYVLPNIISTILVQGTMTVSGSILSGATLSFIGLGVQAPMPEWGTMLSESMTYIKYFPHLIVSPGVALILTALAINTFGDCLRDALDPKLKGKA